MAHARLIRTCMRCHKTIEIEVLQDKIEKCPNVCQDTQNETVTWCSVCHQQTTQLAHLVHLSQRGVDNLFDVQAGYHQIGSQS